MSSLELIAKKSGSLNLPVFVKFFVELLENCFGASDRQLELGGRHFLVEQLAEVDELVERSLRDGLVIRGVGEADQILVRARPVRVRYDAHSSDGHSANDRKLTINDLKAHELATG